MNSGPHRLLGKVSNQKTQGSNAHTQSGTPKITYFILVIWLIPTYISPGLDTIGFVVILICLHKTEFFKSKVFNFIKLDLLLRQLPNINGECATKVCDLNGKAKFTLLPCMETVLKKNRKRTYVSISAIICVCIRIVSINKLCTVKVVIYLF